MAADWIATHEEQTLEMETNFEIVSKQTPTEVHQTGLQDDVVFEFNTCRLIFFWNTEQAV